MGTKSSKASKNKVTENDKAVLNIKVQKRKLVEYQKRVEESSKAAAENAKRMVGAGQRERARTELRKKKFMEGQLDRIDQQLLKMEEMLLNIQEAVQTSQVVERLKAGNVALKEIQQGMRVEDVDRLMEEMSDAAANLEDVNELLQEGLSSEDLQTAELELESLESEIFADELPAIPTNLKMPETAFKAKERKQVIPETADGVEALRQHAGTGVVRQTEPELEHALLAE